jgi:hypothetical protein
VRVGKQISDEHVDKLLSLHLDAIKIKHGPDKVEDIEAKSVYLFWTNEKRIQHNIKNLVKMNGPDNPTSVSHQKEKVANMVRLSTVILRGVFLAFVYFMMDAKFLFKDAILIHFGVFTMVHVAPLLNEYILPGQIQITMTFLYMLWLTFLSMMDPFGIVTIRR